MSANVAFRHGNDWLITYVHGSTLSLYVCLHKRGLEKAFDTACL
jgi:hypothetical protein